MSSKIKLILAVLSISLGTILHLSCKGSDETGTQQQDPFTDKPWQLKELTITPAVDWDLDGKTESNIFPLLEFCEKDQKLVLQNNHRIVRYSDSEECEEEEDETGSWTYNEKDRKLTLEENEESREMIVTEHRSDRLVLNYEFTSTDGRKHKMTAVYAVRR